MDVSFTCKSVTYAMKGKKILERAGISARVQKISGGIEEGSSCLYIIIVKDIHYEKAKNVLINSGVKLIF